MNSTSQVVGFSYLSGDNFADAFLYSSGVLYDLNNLVVPNTFMTTLTSASSISDKGFITGYGTGSDGDTHAFLLTPIPEPATIVSLGTGLLASFGFLLRRRRRTV